MLTDWPRESGKELGTATTDLRAICKSFEIIIEWNTRACFPFPNHSCMYTYGCVNISLLRTLFIWSLILYLSLVVFFLLQVIARKLGAHHGNSINLHSQEHVTPSPGTSFPSPTTLFKSNEHVSLKLIHSQTHSIVLSIRELEGRRSYRVKSTYNRSSHISLVVFFPDKWGTTWSFTPSRMILLDFTSIFLWVANRVASIGCVRVWSTNS